MISAIFVGMLTNCLTIAFCTLTGAFALILRYKHPLRFYGIRQQQDEIRIILPRLDIKAGVAAAAITIDKGYAGPAVAQPEYEAAVLLQEQIRPNVFAWFSREIRDWISGKLVIAAAANPMGGPAYNAAAGHFQKHEGVHFAFTRDAPGAEWYVRSIRGGTPRDPSIIKSRTIGRELAFIQRITHRDTGAKITMCSRTGAGATSAAAEWLSDNYRRLGRRSRNGEYGILLAFEGVTDPQSRFPGEISARVLDQVFDGRRDC